jgi:catechol 2,3-dioxygenase
MSVTIPRPTPAQSLVDERIVYGAVHLDVTDRSRAVGFWSGLVGLEVLGDGADGLRLGVEDRELVVLHPGATEPTPRGHSGLYHLALHLPSEAEFARVLLRIAQADYQQAPTDHIMHWATYLWDPDGIGLELSFETLDRFSHYTFANGHPVVIDSSGATRRATDHLDLQEVISYLDDRDLSRPLPTGTRVGHIHLHVGDIAENVDFYRDTIGFTPNMQEPLIGMADMHADGGFPHRLAMNVWQGEGASQRPTGTAGLRHFELRVRSEAELEAISDRLGAPSGLVHDPSGNALTLTLE